MDPSNHETLEAQQLHGALPDQLEQTAPNDPLSRMPPRSSDAPRQPSTATPQYPYNVFPPSSSTNHHSYTPNVPRSVTQSAFALLSYQSPYMSSQVAQGFHFQPQLGPHPAFQKNAPTSTVYPPGAVPIACPSAPLQNAVAPSPLGPASTHAKLVHALTATVIRRPKFASQAPAPIPANSSMALIKHTTDTFNAAATNDPVYYLLYRRFLEAQPSVAYPKLVYYLRLELQIGWIGFLGREGRQEEIGDTDALVKERKDMIIWLVRQYDVSLKQRAGQYLRGQLAKFAPLSFDPNEVSPVAVLIDHLYVLETEIFYKTVEVPGPSRQEYRIRVVTYIDNDGGMPKVHQDLNVWKKLGFAGLSRMLSNATSNIQSARFHYNNGWECGGTNGYWLYQIVSEEPERPEEPLMPLASDADLGEVKKILAQGQGIIVSHTQQYEIWENLILADTLGLTLDRPGQACKPLPPGYLSAIMREYPNHMASSYLSNRVVAAGGHGLAIRVRRGRRSEVVRRAKRKQDKERKGLGALATRPKEV
ncbi:hypothetical protein E4T42_09589 [Aureobasidium subglaciale]|nr:hypothetical protein E4T42_09589 [Aureobasidium subglaciale]